MHENFGEVKNIKKKNTTSDDELIGLLSKPINNYLKGKTLRVNLSPKNIELLINASMNFVSNNT